MEALISTFHLNAGLLIAQIVNFAVVFAILYFFVFRPLFRVMGDRSAKIKQGLADAEEIAGRLEAAKAEHAKLIRDAKAEAAGVLEEANRKAEARKDELVAKAKEEIGALINREKANIQAEKAETLAAIRSEVADLIRLSWEKILSEKMDKTSDEKLLAKTLKHLE